MCGEAELNCYLGALNEKEQEKNKNFKIWLQSLKLGMEKVFHKCLKNTIDLLSFYREHFYGIVVIYETVEKKKSIF